MTGYIAVCLLTAVALLLLPLPALSPSADPPPPATTTTTTTTTSPNITATDKVFRMLCGQEVLTLTEEEFLFRSLAREMSPTYHDEALKAQAVATYTYYCRRRDAQKVKPDPALSGADFAAPDSTFPTAVSDDKLKEKWGTNYTAYREKLIRAVQAVAGKAMTRDGEYIDACYFAISNGHTESAETVWGADVPYLQAVASPGDTRAQGYQTTATFTPAEIKTALADTAVHFPDDPAQWFGSPTLSAAGTVVSVPVGDRSLAGTEVRRLLGLRSATFSVVYEQERFTFTVRGYGHGVGMSQYGAHHLAQEGLSWEQILHHYYTNVTIL